MPAPATPTTPTTPATSPSQGRSPESRRRAGDRSGHRPGHRSSDSTDRRTLRREVRRRARAIRRRLATPPPVYLTGDAPETPPAGAHGGGTNGPQQFLRTRWKLVVAALPLACAAILLVLNVADVGPFGDGEDERGPVEAADADVGSGTEPGVNVERHPSPGLPPADGLPAAAAWAEVAEVAVSPPAPTPPEGHQAVAIRFAAPDAVDLAGVGDMISVVDLGGDVLTSGAEVLQDRSTPQASVLVVAVPVADAPAVAAAALAQDLTLLVYPPGD